MQEYLVGKILPGNRFVWQFFIGRSARVDQWGYPSSAMRFRNINEAVRVVRRNKGASVLMIMDREPA